MVSWYLRKYWRLMPCSITVRDRTDLEELISTKRFRQIFRYFLTRNFVNNSNFQKETSQLKEEDLKYYKENQSSEIQILDYEHLEQEKLYKILGLSKYYSIRITEIEKEFFYLRCLKLGYNPQIILRIFLRLSKYHNDWIQSPDYVIGGQIQPGYLLDLLHIQIPNENNQFNTIDTQITNNFSDKNNNRELTINKNKSIDFNSIFIETEKAFCRGCGKIIGIDQSTCKTCFNFAKYILEVN